MCVPSFNLLCLTVPEKSVTKIFNVWKLERKKNEEIKGWIRAAAWFPYTRYTHPVSMCVPSFNLLGLTVPEKSVTKNFHLKGYGMTEWWKDRANPVQAPLFQSGAILILKPAYKQIDIFTSSLRKQDHHSITWLMLKECSIHILHKNIKVFLSYHHLLFYFTGVKRYLTTIIINH